MKTPNRIIMYILSFLLSASSIPNIWANTNVETNQAEAQLPADITPADITAIADPLQKHLTLLAAVSDELSSNLNNGSLVLPLQEVLKQELEGTKLFASQILADIGANKPDTNMQVLCEVIIGTQLDRIIDIINDKRPTEPNMDAIVENVQSREQTAQDIENVVTAINHKFQLLHNAINKRSKTSIDRTNDNALKQLCTVDMILEELAQYINNQSIKVPNKQAIIDSISIIRTKMIEPLKYDRAQVTEQRINNMLKVSAYLMEQTRNLLTTNFKDIDAIDITTVLNDTRDKAEITIEELDATYQENEKLLLLLRKDCQGAGLTWYNHAARTINSTWTYLDASNRLPYIAAGLFAASIYAHQSGMLPQYIKDLPVPFTSLKWYGEKADWSAVLDGNKPIIKSDGSILRELNNSSSMGVFAHVYDFFLQPFLKNPVFEVPAMLAIGGVASDYNRFKYWSGEYINKLTSFILGKKTVKNNAQMMRIEPRCTFKDVIGQQEIKDTLSKIVRYIEDPQSIDNRGLKLEKGYLFTGKTRSGKSFMAEALAGEIKAMLKRNGKDENTFNFFVLPADLLREPGKFRQCMRDARLFEPCILFIDEIHLLDLQSGKNSSLLGEFLTELSGCLSNDPQSKVFVIAATNQEEKLDKALVQSGRFAKEIRFDYPTLQDRTTFIIDSLEKRSVNVSSLDIVRFARETEQCTYENITQTIEDAFITAKFNVESLSQKHLDYSFDKNIRGIVFGSHSTMSDQERSIIAIHQAGYTLATKLLAPRQTIAKVTTLPVRERINEATIVDQYTKPSESKPDRIVHGKLFTYTLNHHKAVTTTQSQINACIIASAGYAAGNLLLGKANNSIELAKEKRTEAFNLAKTLVAHGINFDDLDNKLKYEYEKRALAFRNACEKKATALLEQNKQALEFIAGTLFEHNTLMGHDIEAILSQCQITMPQQDETLLDMVNDQSPTE